MLKRFFLVLLCCAGLVWTYYWYVRGINLLLDEPQPNPEPLSWAVRLPAKDDLVASQPVWIAVSPMPTPRTAAAAAVVNDEIFVVGGLDGFIRTLATVEAYDYRKNQWRSVAPVPTELHHAAVVGLNGKLYVFGGLKGAGSGAMKSVFVYDPVKAIWKQLNDLPNAFGSAAPVVVDGKIHLLGGESPSQTYNQHLVYDDLTDSWQEMDDLTFGGRDRAVAVVSRGKIWLIGGRAGSTLYNSSSVWVEDVTNGGWDEAVSMNVARSAFAAGVNGRLYVMGGLMPTVVNPSVEAYDFDTKRWELIAPMPRPRYDTAFAQVENRIFLIGGSARIGFSVSDLVDVMEIPPAAHEVKKP